MLGIANSDGEFLELPPGTKMELEQASPFLQFDGQLIGDFSTPLEVRLSPKNQKWLHWAGIMQTRIQNTGIDCSVYDNNLQHSIGKIKIESPTHNLQNANRASVSLFYLSGVASFFQDIKELKMRDVDFDGIRSYGWDGYNRSGAGFWAHIHQVLDAAPTSYDYAFYPVINKAWAGDDGQKNEVMNNVAYSGGQVNFQKLSTDGLELNAVVPFPYLKYVLEKIMQQVGWKIQGTILQDPDFVKCTLVNFQAIDYGFMSVKDAAKAIILGPTVEPGEHPSQVEFNLAQHMPDMSVAEFMLALKNRFGWWYDFDRRTKTITIQELQNVVGSRVKDYTLKAATIIPKKVAQSSKIYALKNEFYGEYANGQPSLESVKYMGEVQQLHHLPAPSKTQYAHTYLVLAENNYYICRETPGTDDDIYSYQFYAYNVYDVKPAGATDEITTKATCIGVEKYSTYLDLVPRMDLSGNWNEKTTSTATWGIHLLMFHGLKANKAGQPVPYACSHVYDSQGNLVSNWALAYQCKRFDGIEVGLYERAWKTILTSLQNAETFELSLYLSKAEMLDLKFSDTLIINGVKMYISKTRPMIPHDGTLVVECIRI